MLRYLRIRDPRPPAEQGEDGNDPHVAASMPRAISGINVRLQHAGRRTHQGIRAGLVAISGNHD
jgi:hypothetical protein